MDMASRIQALVVQDAVAEDEMLVYLAITYGPEAPPSLGKVWIKSLGLGRHRSTETSYRYWGLC